MLNLREDAQKIITESQIRRMAELLLSSEDFYDDDVKILKLIINDNGSMNGDFKDLDNNRVFEFAINGQDVSYKPRIKGRRDSTDWSDSRLLLQWEVESKVYLKQFPESRFDARKKRGKIKKKPKCTGISYNCGKRCLGVDLNCRVSERNNRSKQRLENLQELAKKHKAGEVGPFYAGSEKKAKEVEAMRKAAYEKSVKRRESAREKRKSKQEVENIKQEKEAVEEQVGKESDRISREYIENVAGKDTVVGGTLKNVNEVTRGFERIFENNVTPYPDPEIEYYLDDRNKTFWGQGATQHYDIETAIKFTKDDLSYIESNSDNLSRKFYDFEIGEIEQAKNITDYADKKIGEYKEDRKKFDANAVKGTKIEREFKIRGYTATVYPGKGFSLVKGDVYDGSIGVHYDKKAETFNVTHLASGRQIGRSSKKQDALDMVERYRASNIDFLKAERDFTPDDFKYIKQVVEEPRTISRKRSKKSDRPTQKLSPTAQKGKELAKQRKSKDFQEPPSTSPMTKDVERVTEAKANIASIVDKLGDASPKEFDALLKDLESEQKIVTDFENKEKQGKKYISKNLFSGKDDIELQYSKDGFSFNPKNSETKLWETLEKLQGDEWKDDFDNAPNVPLKNGVVKHKTSRNGSSPGKIGKKLSIANGNPDRYKNGGGYFIVDTKTGYDIGFESKKMSELKPVLNYLESLDIDFYNPETYKNDGKSLEGEVLTKLGDNLRGGTKREVEDRQRAERRQKEEEIRKIQSERGQKYAEWEKTLPEPEKTRSRFEVDRGGYKSKEFGTVLDGKLGVHGEVPPGKNRVNKKYHITHLASGKSLGGGYDTEDSAVRSSKTILNLGIDLDKKDFSPKEKRKLQQVASSLYYGVGYSYSELSTKDKDSWVDDLPTVSKKSDRPSEKLSPTAQKGKKAVDEYRQKKKT